MGAASYLLISFWYRRTTATGAGIKAFVINVIGDVGLVIAAFLLLNGTGALDYAGVFAGAEEAFGFNDGTLVAACLLILVGAFAKSAQLPLHTWLPDAMAGPTPVSALIHAATMVTAGVYLIARCYPLFELAPTAAEMGAVIGTATLVFAATVAAGVTDLKRVIADSTISQIGYMILGVCVAAYSDGLFHLMTSRLLQGSAVHGRRLCDRRDGGHPGPRPHGRLSQGDALHVRHLHHRRPSLAGFPLSPAGSPRTRSSPSRSTAEARTWCSLSPATWRPADRLLRLPDGVPGLLRRSRARGRGARGRGTPLTRSRPTR